MVCNKKKNSDTFLQIFRLEFAQQKLLTIQSKPYLNSESLPSFENDREDNVIMGSSDLFIKASPTTLC
ncbi:hypothetical protein ACSBR2_003738 [Camellia fascicularis]